MEKINYQLILDTFYASSTWTRTEGSKGYQYEAYAWSETNVIPKPSKEELDSKWILLKRQTPIFQLFLTKRLELLKESDIYALPDYPHKTPEIKEAWLNYRQALRDLPETAEPYFNNDAQLTVNWPIKPDYQA